MPMANLVEYFLSRAGATVRHIFKALPDCFMHIGARDNIEKPLIRFRVLHDRFRFALDGQYDWPFGLFELLHKLAGIAPESCDRVDVFRDVEHGKPSL
jgi:hypothetical protein